MSMWCPNKECPDALELGTPGEFVDGIIACPFCGEALVSYRPAWADQAAPEIQLAPVMPVADASWLPRIKATLDAADIRFLVQDAGPGGGGSRFDPGAGRLMVMVEEGDLERATALLGTLKAELGLDPGGAPPELTPPAWQPSSCPQCGQTLESAEGDEPLAYCYHCGASLSPEAGDR